MFNKRSRAWWRKHRFEAIVFITGAAVLVVEVTATRVLSPYYGNTIYTVSSVIGVILGALSVGYWRGGIEADNQGSEAGFYKLIFQSGISLLVLFFLIVAVLPIGGYYFSIQLGPLLWSLLLFFPPSYLMGKLSPYAITLAQKNAPESGLGHITGAIFFWSTTGSIVGSLATGFVLIPYMGVKAIFFSTTLAILLLGGVGQIMSTSKDGAESKKTDHLVTLLFLIFVLLSVYFISGRSKTPGEIFATDGVYERLSIIDSTYAGKPARFFLQDRTASGAMFLESDELPIGYTKMYGLYTIMTPSLRNALFIGGGAYAMPKALHKESPSTLIDVVDIEPSLPDIAKKYFALPETPFIRTHIADGRRFLFESAGGYDMIYSDVYFSLYSLPTHFTTKEFFSLARSKLSPDGIFLANVIGSSAPTKDSFLFSEIRTMHEIFPHMAVFAIDSTTSPVIQNFVLVGWNSAIDPSPLIAALAKSDDALRALTAHEIPLAQLPLEGHTILTDDYAPVEHLIASLINSASSARKMTQGLE